MLLKIKAAEASSNDFDILVVNQNRIGQSICLEAKLLFFS